MSLPALAGDHLRGSRSTRWEVILTRRDGTVRGLFPTGGRMDWGIDRAHIAGGSLTTATDLGDLIGATIQPVQIINGTQFPMGVFQATADPAKLGPAGTTHTIEFIDPSIRLALTRLQQPLSFPRTTNVVRAARERLDAIGLDVAVPDSDVTLRVALAFDRETPELDVITRLLSAARLSGVRARPHGLVVERLLSVDALPQDSWTLAEGADSVQVIDYGFDSDHLSVANRQQTHTRGDSTTTPLIGSASDRATSRWSLAARGHWVDARSVEVEVTTQEDANAEARRLLSEGLARAERITVQHAWLPEVEVGTVGTFRSLRYPERSGAWQVEAQTMDWSPTALASSTLRRVVRL